MPAAPSLITSLHAFRPPASDRSYAVLSRLRAARAELRCPMLSIKAVLAGEERYDFGERSVRVRAGQFLIVPARTRYEAVVDTRFDTVGRCFYLDHRWSEAFGELPRRFRESIHLVPLDLDELSDDWGSWADDVPAGVAGVALDQWRRRWQRQIARIDRADPVRHAQLLRSLARARRLVTAAYGEDLDVDRLAQAAGMSRSHFARAFARVYGEAPGRFLERVRLETARERILATDATLTRIAQDCGYADLPTFSKAFRRRLGTTPSALRA